MQGRLGYRPALDGLRAVAVLAVIADHGWTAILPGGWVGVDLFFVLSGFLITTLLVEEFSGAGRINLRAFYLRRVRRLGPGLLAVVLAALAFHQATIAQALVVLTDRSNLVVWPWQHLGPLAQTWSLSMEEQFYFVWPLLLWGVLRWRRSPRAAVGVGLLGVVATMTTRLALYRSGVDGNALYFPPFTHGPDALLIGCLAALLRPRQPSRLVLVAACVALAGVLLGLRNDTATQTLIGLAAAPLAAVVIVIHAAGSRSPLAWRPLVWIGKRSYGVYLWHYAVNASLWSLGWRHGPLLLLVTAVGGIGIAAVSYRFVEEPIRSRGRFRRRPGVAEPQGEIRESGAARHATVHA